MERRKAIVLTGTILGGVFIGSEFLLSSCSDKKRGEVPISDLDITLLDEIGDTILPESERSPGAKAANIGTFMKVMMYDCYSHKDKEIFIRGIGEFNQMVEKIHSKGFLELDKDQRYDLLVRLDNDAISFPEKNINRFYRIVKELTIRGYFTSKPGLTKALRYNPIPGKYDGCVPYAVGEAALY